MKKILVCSFLFLAVVSLTFSQDVFTFTLAPIHPVYQESKAYTFSNNVRFSYLKSPGEEEYAVNALLATKKNQEGEVEYASLPFKAADPHNTSFWYMKSASDIALLRLEWKDYVTVEGYIHGGINTLFGAYGGVDTLGFDGQYGGGLDLGLFDTVFLRFGVHHFSGHWGDEVLYDFYETYKKGEDYLSLTEYTRNNSWYMGMRIQPFSFISVGLEAELPQNKAWIRPAAHVQGNTEKPSSEESPEKANTSSHIWNQEGAEGRNNLSYPSSYKAWRIGLDIEGQYAINEKTRLYSILDIQFHQDGKINPLSALYEEDRPWETEYTLAFGLGMREKEELPEFVIEVSLHSGRVPLLNYWFKKTKYVAVGVGLNY